MSIADEVDMDDGGDKDGDEDEDTTAQHSRYLLRDVPYVVEEQARRLDRCQQR